AAAHGDDHVGGVGGVPGEFRRRLVSDVDADLAHRLHRGRVDPVGWLAAGGTHLHGVAGQVAQPPGGHLGPAGVVHADEQDTGLVTHDGRDSSAAKRNRVVGPAPSWATTTSSAARSTPGYRASSSPAPMTSPTNCAATKPVT